MNIDTTPLLTKVRGSCMHRLQRDGAHDLSIVPRKLILFFATAFLVIGLAIAFFGHLIPQLAGNSLMMREFVFGVSMRTLMTAGIFFNTALVFGAHWWFMKFGLRVHCNRSTQSVEVAGRFRKLNRRFSFADFEAIQLCRGTDNEYGGLQLILVLKGNPPERLLLFEASPKRTVRKMATALAEFVGAPMVDSTKTSG